MKSTNQQKSPIVNPRSREKKLGGKKSASRIENKSRVSACSCFRTRGVGSKPSFPEGSYRLAYREEGETIRVSWWRGGGLGVWGGMQQVVRFSKPIEIDGFPIP